MGTKLLHLNWKGAQCSDNHLPQHSPRGQRALLLQWDHCSILSVSNTQQVSGEVRSLNVSSLISLLLSLHKALLFWFVCQKWKVIIYGAKPLRNNDEFGRTGDIAVPGSALRNRTMEEIASLVVWVKRFQNSHYKELSIQVPNCRIQNMKEFGTCFSFEQGFPSNGC